MSFSYSDDHSDATSRMRWAVGDTIAPGKVPDETYTAVLAAKGGDETAAYKAIAAGLAARYGLQPDKLASSGSSVSFTDRVSQLNKVAAGGSSSGNAGASAAAGSGDVSTQAVW